MKNKIIRSSTPTHFFSIIDTDIEIKEGVEIEVRYTQDEELIFSKTGTDIDISESKQISVKLSEEDTNMLDPNLDVYIRVLLIYPDGTRIPSVNNICVRVEDL